MAAQIHVPCGRVEPRSGENRLHVIRLARPDLHQHVASRRQVIDGTGSDCAIGIKAVGSSYKRKRRIEVPDIRAQTFDISGGNIGRI